MKIAITTSGETIQEEIDPRFGRCKNFLIVKLENNKLINLECVENKGAIQGHGAGIKAAQQIGSLGVTTLITGLLGPNATKILDQLKIKSYTASGIIEKAIEDFKNGSLESINEVSQAHKPYSPSEAQIKSPTAVDEKHKTEKIFFPLLDENGLDSKISEHFGHAPIFGAYDFEKKELELIKNDLDHVDQTKSPLEQIQETVHPTIIFAKGIGAKAIRVAKEKGIVIKTGNFTIVRDVLAHYDELQNQEEDCGQRVYE